MIAITIYLVMLLFPVLSLAIGRFVGFFSWLLSLCYFALKATANDASWFSIYSVFLGIQPLLLIISTLCIFITKAKKLHLITLLAVFFEATFQVWTLFVDLDGSLFSTISVWCLFLWMLSITIREKPETWGTKEWGKGTVCVNPNEK